MVKPKKFKYLVTNKKGGLKNFKKKGDAELFKKVLKVTGARNLSIRKVDNIQRVNNLSVIRRPVIKKMIKVRAFLGTPSRKLKKQFL